MLRPWKDLMVRETGRRFAEDCEAAPRLTRYPSEDTANE